MTKAQHIMKLYNGPKKYTDREISEIVGCSYSYVRVTARQRKGSSPSQADKRYEATKKGKIKRRIANKKNNAWFSSMKQTGDIIEARKAGRTAYRRVLKQTGDTDKARNAWKAAWRAILLKTGDKRKADLAREHAYRKARSEAMAS